MLDAFEIFTTSGIVLWSKTFVPISSTLINSFVTNVFIEERLGIKNINNISVTENLPYTHGQHTLKWTIVKELGIIFVTLNNFINKAVYRSLLHLSWVDKLVDNIKIIFVELYGDQLRKPHLTIIVRNFDEYFDQQIQKLEILEKPIVTHNAQLRETSLNIEKTKVSEPCSYLNGSPQLPGLLHDENASDESKETKFIDSSPISTPVSSRSSTPAGHILQGKPGPGGKSSRRARKSARTPPTNANNDSKLIQGRTVTKKGRKWDEFDLFDNTNDVTLDYSASQNEDTSDRKNPAERPGVMKDVENDSWGTKSSNGRFVLKDLDDQVTSILASANTVQKNKDGSNGIMGSSLDAIGGLFRNFIGGKILTREDLEKTLKVMEDHLLKKNVAREAVVRLCEGVERELVGTKTGSFESQLNYKINFGVSAKILQIRSAMESSLTKILTPTSCLDLLREIEAVTSPSGSSFQERRPFIISIVGVNGVGKSTSLSKICYFLLKNKLKVLIVACDTFRSGAVEQLAVHVRNLQELTDREGGHVQLYQKGYGKDAANVARDAVNFAGQNDFDVVLIDTAGRRHNDKRLMSSLEKFAKFANPDKILMVGEALVGTDSVAQARNFNTSFGKGRMLDGFIISKCDTVGDMVGTLVSMVHATNVPVLFVGVGQHYSDLRNLSVCWAVEKLLSNN
ncbi:Signal recognition particle receptor subunit alpha-like protein [Erysiphe neolycopersici]|uniref:Signal recognition particle receptor subunit alpha homolog n=1 Tax=Erysiphe neolycopersici TaxID=212602 RepID=A0A420HUD8_9PEZI|nr:Signal recognition particle receptor subunit alpha-like protein [Erysiphe neolycopersici]